MTARSDTRTVFCGNGPSAIAIGGAHPISIQSMANTDTRDIPATIGQIKGLADAGCEIVRLAVPDMVAAQALKVIREAVSIPLVADIHFDYRLALAAIEYGVDKLRINPGNIGGMDRVRLVASAAKKAGIPIRIGVNGGSLERDIEERHGGITPEGLVESALRHIRMLESCDFYDIVVSVKASSVPLTLATHRLLAEVVNYPLHIGITESGTPYAGTIKSAAGIGALLSMGLGDTVRVSLTGDPVDEVRCAREILQAMGLRRFGPEFVSCPTCGRTEIDMVSVANHVEAYCRTVKAPIKVAVMGCIVNGPGEARDADFGVACGRGNGILFKKGKIIRKVPFEHLTAALIGEIEGYVRSQ